MILAELIWGDASWRLPAAAILVIAVAAVAWSYWRAPSTRAVRGGGAALKLLAVLALAICLIEPLVSGTRPRPGANLFVLLADDSESLQIRDDALTATRGELLRAALDAKTPWRTRLGQDFDVRGYAFDNRLRAIDDFSHLASQGQATSLFAALETLGRRYRGRPLAGILLLTDGAATDESIQQADWKDLPPVYPVVLGRASPGKDISIGHVAVSGTNFEDAPVTIRAELAAAGFQGQSLVAQLLDESGRVLQQQTVESPSSDAALAVRFQVRPQQPGVSFYRLKVAPESELKSNNQPRRHREATQANNSRLLAVDRGRGPYRVLYVSGRPNWEFKFLRRALARDEPMKLVGLVRIAKREPKCHFLGRLGEKTNPLFRGFENQADEQAEQYDQPVLVRLGTEDAAELRDGFPKTADQLFRYDAVIIDDLEAEFFTQDQMTLLDKFVSHRGGGLLMLGGQESFREGNYARTPLGDLLPVYLERKSRSRPGAQFRLALTRDGWLQPWIRLRRTEKDEHARLEAMPFFGALNHVAGVKPGASLLAEVKDADGKSRPALVAQRCGRGRSAALLIGDLWRWSLRRAEPEQQDMEKAWRQMLRWLVADVPRRVQIAIEQAGGEGAVRIEVKACNRDYRPLDNAAAVVRVISPDGKELELTATPAEADRGVYTTTYTPRQAGGYRVSVVIKGADGAEVGKAQTGWVSDPSAKEYRRLAPNRELLENIAKQTGGEVVELDDLDDFVASLPNRKIPITQPWIYPLWHQPAFFLLAIVALASEWGLRRWKGLA